MTRMSLLESLLTLTALDRLPRTGWLQRGIEPAESVAGHILGTAYLARGLAETVDPGLDLGRVLELALLHDAPEALTGDLPWGAARHLPTGAKAAMDASAARELLAPLFSGAPELVAAYAAGNSREARFVHVCDRLQLGVQLLVYMRSGRRGLAEFLVGLRALDCSEFGPAAEFQAALLLGLAACEASPGV